MKRFVLAVGVAVVAAGLSVAVAMAGGLVSIGTGPRTGVYYQVTLGICKLVKERLGPQGYACYGQVSMGSLFNIIALDQRLVNFGMVQSDINWQAYQGEGYWKDSPYKALRSVFSVHPETVMLVTRADTGIASVSDLRGKRVNIANVGSGSRGNAEDVLRLYGINKTDDIEAERLDPPEANRRLVSNEIDAFFFTAGNPWKAVLETAKKTNIRIVPIDGPAIKKLVADKPYYVMATVPGGLYKGVNRDVPTYAVKATFVTSANQPEEVVYNVTKTVFENLDRFRKMHPAFKFLKAKEMLQGLSAPLHPGAMRYYKERGWM